MKTFDAGKLYKQSDLKNMNGDNSYISDKARRRNADPALLRVLETQQTNTVKETISIPNYNQNENTFLSDCINKTNSLKKGQITIKHAKSTTNGFVKLTDATFIIPVKIDSNDRLQNFHATINYLSTNLDTNIIIYEMDEHSKLQNIVKDNVTHIFEQNDTQIFHRTRYLNYMLNMSKTPITVNYDIDVVLPVESYVEACKKILNENYDLVYPYGYGNFQHKVNPSGRDKIIVDPSLTKLVDSDFETMYFLSWFGHCQFFNTNTYKQYGGENEYFVSYGPEDFERYSRFVNLETKVLHLKDRIVYHFEHERGSNSSSKNPFFPQNDRLYNILKSKPKEYLQAYYTSVEYTDKYKV